jgi:hypothetical protein
MNPRFLTPTSPRSPIAARTALAGGGAGGGPFARALVLLAFAGGCVAGDPPVGSRAAAVTAFACHVLVEPLAYEVDPIRADAGFDAFEACVVAADEHECVELDAAADALAGAPVAALRERIESLRAALGCGLSSCVDVACGDGLCERPGRLCGGVHIIVPAEDEASCPADCGWCGDAVCRAGETSASCPADCAVCGDGVCELGERSTCLRDCSTVCRPRPGALCTPVPR